MLKQIGFSALSFIKANKAQILIGAGIVGNAAATVIACKQTFTASSIIENHKFRRAEVEEAKNICRREIEVFDIAAGNDQNGKVYTEQKPCSSDDYLKYTQYLEHDSKRELLKVYAKTGLKFAKHYWVPATLFLLSNAAIGYGTGVMTKQVTGLSTALAGVTTAFSSYRDRIKNVIGEEAERKIFNNEQVKVVTYKDIAEDGETEVEKEQAVIMYDGKYDPYAILIDYHYHGWSDNIFTLLSNLKSDEIWANDELRKKHAKGLPLFMYKVSRHMGYADTDTSRVVGWSKDNEDGDKYVDFGLFEHVDPKSGYESEDPLMLKDEIKEMIDSRAGMPNQYASDAYDIWVHFNVDGPVLKFMNKQPGLPL